MRVGPVFVAILCLCALLAAVSGPTPAFAEEKVKMVTKPITPTSPASGVEMFKQYCASCHGLDAKGNGPAAPALKVPAADLTMISARNGGKFPELKVYAVISGDTATPAHGSKDMPVWGTVLRSLSGRDSELHQRIGNLTRYIESLQKK